MIELISSSFHEASSELRISFFPSDRKEWALPLALQLLFSSKGDGSSLLFFPPRRRSYKPLPSQKVGAGQAESVPLRQKNHFPSFLFLSAMTPPFFFLLAGGFSSNRKGLRPPFLSCH